MSQQDCLQLCVVSLLCTLLGSGANRATAEEQQICRYCERQVRQQELGEAAPDLEADGYHYAPDRDVDVLHLKLDVTPKFDDKTVSGTATLTFVPISRPLRELRLDGVHLDVSAVRGSVPVKEFSATADDVTVLFEEPILPGAQADVEIEYRAQPSQGLYFRTADMGYDEGDVHLWTQGETHQARHWYPCFDHPNERSSTEVICRIPAAMTVLSNGKRMSEQLDEKSGLKAVRWLQEKPHANYLICLVAGYFSELTDRHDEVPLSFYTQPSTAEYAANSFQDTAKIMAFYEKEIGVPFPWDKYAQVTILDFPWGGMENTSLTTLTSKTLFSEATENIHSSRRLDAHEMAHQWFGDYVTCKDWSHLWLNEGFATFYTHLYEGHKFGKDAMLYGLYTDAKDRVLRNDADTRPIVFNRFSSPAEQFDYRAYPKGSWVLHMLRCQLGEELYRTCIRTYLKRHALSSVESDDLQSVIEELSGRSFDRFFDQWVYRARYPDLKVTYRWQPKSQLARLTVEQTHATNRDVMLFQFPTLVRFLVDGKPVDHPLEIRKRKHDFYVPLTARPTSVRFDPDYTLLANVRFNKSDAMLLAQLQNQQDVIGRLLAIDALGKRKTNDAVNALRHALRHDPFYGVRQAAASSLARVHTDEAFDALARARKQEDARVRESVLRGISRYYRPAVLDIMCEVADHESNPAIVAVAIEALGKYQHQKSDRRIRHFLKSESFRNELARAAVDAIDSRKSPAFRADLMATINDRGGELSSRDLGQCLQVVARLSRPIKKKRDVREMLVSHLQDPRETVRIAAVTALGSLGDRQAHGALSTIASDDRDDPLAKAARRALNALEKTRTFVPSEVRELRKQITDMKRDHDKLQDALGDLKQRVKAQNDASQSENGQVATQDAHSHNKAARQ